MSTHLLSINNDAKTSKGIAQGWLTGILYLAPYNIANRRINLCPNATPQCKAGCLYTAGRGQFTTTQQARIRKTGMFLKQREQFISDLMCDLRSLTVMANRQRLRPCVRLNGTSDIAWEEIAPELFTQYPEIAYYDYTKSYDRMIKFLGGGMPKNYYLTFSHSGKNYNDCAEIMSYGGTACVVFKGGLPKTWRDGWQVVDGDVSDLRILDPKGCVIGLKAKGKARKLPVGGFVQQGI